MTNQGNSTVGDGTEREKRRRHPARHSRFFGRRRTVCPFDRPKPEPAPGVYARRTPRHLANNQKDTLRPPKVSSLFRPVLEFRTRSASVDNRFQRGGGRGQPTPFFAPPHPLQHRVPRLSPRSCRPSTVRFALDPSPPSPSPTKDPPPRAFGPSTDPPRTEGTVSASPSDSLGQGRGARVRLVEKKGLESLRGRRPVASRRRTHARHPKRKSKESNGLQPGLVPPCKGTPII